MKRMQAKYRGTCIKCGQAVSIGMPIVFLGSKRVMHAACYDAGDGGTQDSPSETKPPKTLPAGTRVFNVDWADLRSKILAGIGGNYSAFPNHVSEFLSHAVNPREGWQGYTGADVKRWLEKGYESDAIKGLGDFTPPLRKKRKLRYSEEGDEFHYDLAASGDEKFMSEFTKKDRIPGASVLVHVGFSAGVSWQTLLDYSTWVCRAIYALDIAGIDSEVSLHCNMVNIARGDEKNHYDTRIRIKKENEVVDFQSFAAMFSPAQFRCLVFCAEYLHCESVGRRITPGHGRDTQNHEWSVRWNAEEKKLEIASDYYGSPFPQEKMERELRQALKDMSHG